MGIEKYFLVRLEGVIFVYLKWIEIIGFKLFVDKIIIEFEDDVIVVVGLNGSGKSNIMEVVCWVLGE